MTEDVLSDVLSAVRLTGAVYFDFALTSPWVAEAPPAEVIAPVVMPDAQRVIEYHLVARGSCWAHAVGEAPVRMREGDIVLFPQGDPHVLSSAPGLRAAPDPSMYARSAAPLPIVFEHGGGGPEESRVICGFLGFDDRPYNPLLDSLPRTMHLHVSPDDGWIGSMFMTAVKESRSRRPGGENVLARLSELMFVEAVRRHLEQLPDARTGWLAGLRDPIVGQALAALHGDPAAAWTVDTLARRAGASRSVLAERFTALVGQPPMQYLTMWRMQLASKRLIDGAGVADVAGAVGYESEAAFSRAFKKTVGKAPAAWRRERASGGRGREGVAPR